jgi:hypothetical protein
MNERTKEMTAILDEWEQSDKSEDATVLANRLLVAVMQATREQDTPLSLDLRLIRFNHAYAQTESYKKAEREWQEYLGRAK